MKCMKVTNKTLIQLFNKDFLNFICSFTLDIHEVVLRTDTNKSALPSSNIYNIHKLHGITETIFWFCRCFPFSPLTYIWGSEQIDFIHSTPNILSFIKNAMIMSNEKIYYSDHSALMIDINLQKTTKNHTSEIPIQLHTCSNLYSTNKKEQYCSKLKDQIHKEKS